MRMGVILMWPQVEGVMGASGEGWLDGAILLTYLAVFSLAGLLAVVGHTVRSIRPPRVITRLRRRFLSRKTTGLATSFRAQVEPGFHLDVGIPMTGSFGKLVVFCTKVRVTCRSAPGSAVNFTGWVENEFGIRHDLAVCADWMAVRMPREKRIAREDLIVTKTTDLKVDQAVEGYWVATLDRASWDDSGSLWLRLVCKSDRGAPAFLSVSRLSGVDKTKDLARVSVETAQDGGSSSVRSSTVRLVCLPTKDLAGELGVPHSTVRNWSSGRTAFVPEKHRGTLAEFLRAHAKRLDAMAEELGEDAMLESDPDRASANLSMSPSHSAFVPPKRASTP